MSIFQDHNFNLIPHLVALTIAYVLALPIGWNREKAHRAAGLRTFPLVAMASCGIVEAAESLTMDNPEAMARIVEGIITGMGFIGGGAILRTQGNVSGTATAASLWATGAMGMAVGLSSYDVAVIISIITFATFWLFVPIKNQLEGEKKDL